MSMCSLAKNNMEKERESIKYYGIKTNCMTLIPEIVEIDFKIVYHKSKYINRHYIKVIKGGVTGYEEAPLKEVINKYLEGSPFNCWCACFGTLNKYHRLDIPVNEIIKYLVDNEYIEVFKEYGYIKEIKWLKEILT